MHGGLKKIQKQSKWARERPPILFSVKANDLQNWNRDWNMSERKWNSEISQNWLGFGESIQMAWLTQYHTVESEKGNPYLSPIVILWGIYYLFPIYRFKSWWPKILCNLPRDLLPLDIAGSVSPEGSVLHPRMCRGSSEDRWQQGDRPELQQAAKHEGKPGASVFVIFCHKRLLSKIILGWLN